MTMHDGWPSICLNAHWVINIHFCKSLQNQPFIKLISCCNLHGFEKTFVLEVLLEFMEEKVSTILMKETQRTGTLFTLKKAEGFLLTILISSKKDKWCILHKYS
jgi:hypothetical protein